MSPFLAAALNVEGLAQALFVILGIALVVVVVIWVVGLFVPEPPLKNVRIIIGLMGLVAVLLVLYRYIF